jgi:uncharacterized protein
VAVELRGKVAGRIGQVVVLATGAMSRPRQRAQRGSPAAEPQALPGRGHVFHAKPAATAVRADQDRRWLRDRLRQVKAGQRDRVNSRGVSAFAADVVALLERLAGAGPLPRVRALHLPPPAADGTRAGEFCAVELEDGSLGLSFVLLGDTLAQLRAARGRSALAGMSALLLAQGYANDTGAQRALGFAAVNALTRHLFDRSRYEPPVAGGSIGDLDLRPGDRLGMVGLFPPLVPQVLASGAQLTVVELRADLAGARDGWHVTLDAGELARCNKILSTSTVLLNDTLESMLARCRHAEQVALVGPGAGCLPDPLFARGVTLLGGSWIVDAAAFKAALGAGEPWGGAARKFVIRRDGYPGFDHLLADARAHAPRYDWPSSCARHR